MKKILLSSFAAAVVISSAYAENSELQSVDVWETEIVSSSINLKQTAMETKQADHLSDLFRDIPGVDVGGSHSINNKIYIRGINDTDLDIKIDGATQSTVDMFHHQSSLKINPDILKRVSIEVGNNSVVHGGLGGSIEFETKDGKDFLSDGEKVGAIISSTYNSNKSASGSLSLFGQITPDSDIFVYYNYTDNKNWETGGGDTEIGKDGNISNLLVKYAVNYATNQRLTFSYDRLKDEGDYLPRPNFSAAINEAINRGDIHPTEYTRDTATIKHELDLGDKILLKTSLYHNEMNLIRYEDNDNGRGDKFDALVKNQGLNSRAQSNIEIDNILQTFTYGINYDEQSSHVAVDGDDYGDDERAKTLALYVENAIDFNNGLVVTPGVRFTRYKLDGLLGDINDNETTYSLAGEYSFNENFTVLASTSTLFKGVAMQEVFASDRTYIAENDNIKSETGKNSEIGFKYILDNTLGANSIGLSAKYFKTEIDNYIEYTDDYSTLENIGETTTKGAEVTFAYNLDKFNGLLSYSHAASNVQDTGNPISNEVGDTYALNLNYKATPEVELSWKSIFVLSEDAVEDIYKKSYNVHDIAVKYTPSAIKGLKLIAGIDNIFDKEYSSHSSATEAVRNFGYNLDTEPGRNIKVTISYKF